MHCPSWFSECRNTGLTSLFSLQSFSLSLFNHFMIYFPLGMHSVYFNLIAS